MIVNLLSDTINKVIEASSNRETIRIFGRKIKKSFLSYCIASVLLAYGLTTYIELTMEKDAVAFRLMSPVHQYMGALDRSRVRLNLNSEISKDIPISLKLITQQLKNIYGSNSSIFSHRQREDIELLINYFEKINTQTTDFEDSTLESLITSISNKYGAICNQINGLLYDKSKICDPTINYYSKGGYWSVYQSREKAKLIRKALNSTKYSV